MHSLPICYVTPKHMGPVMHSLRILLPLNLEFSGWTLFDAIYESATPKVGIIECSQLDPVMRSLLRICYA